MIEFEKYELENGLKVILHQDKSTPLAAINVLYDVGARDEDEHRTGFAHLFEHLMFGGSENIPSFDTPLQKAGGENNAYTTNDVTNYYMTIPIENIETGFWLESDRMLQLDFSQHSLDVQKNVVIEEFKQRYLNQPYGDVWLNLRPLAFQKHPYKWPTIGKDIQHIEDATLDDVKHFFKKHYHPGNAILSVAGDFEFDQMKVLIEKWFGSIPANSKAKRQLPKEPEQLTERNLSLERDVPANALYKVYHMVNRNHEDYATTDLISDILGRSESSRLHQKLVKEKQLFSEINAYVTGDFDEGLLVISGKTLEGIDLEDADSALEQELNELIKSGCDERELQKVRNKVESTLKFSELTVLNKAMNLAMAELMGDIQLVNTEFDKYLKVTKEDIHKVANKLLKKSNCSTLLYRAK